MAKSAHAFATLRKVVEFDGADPQPGLSAAELPVAAQVYKALVRGVRDYI
jgi:NAD+ synthase (glutamine-hydrolysing)